MESANSSRLVWVSSRTAYLCAYQGQSIFDLQRNQKIELNQLEILTANVQRG